MILSACVPTPDKEYVTQKDMTHMLDLAKGTTDLTEDVINKTDETNRQQTALRERCKAPRAIDKSISLNNNRFHLNMNAIVSVPNSTTIPILRIEQADFSQNEVKNLFDFLCGEEEMYYVQDQGIMTKKQIADEIAQYSDEMSDSSFEKNNSADYVLFVQDRLNYLKSIYSDAPETVELDMCDGTLREMHHYSETNHVPLDSYWGIEATGRTSADNSMLVFSVENNNDVVETQSIDGQLSYKSNGARLKYMNMRRITTREKLDYIPFPNQDVGFFTYSPYQAEQDVKEMLSKTNLSYLQIDSIYQLKGKSEEQQSSEAYLIQCVRVIESVPNTYLEVGTASRLNAFSPVWQYESFDVCIDKDGIFYLRWLSPYRITDTVLGDCNLLPFDNIIEIFSKQMEITYAATMGNPDMISKGGGAVIEREYYIDRITLGLQRISEPEVFDTAFLVPSWNFYGIVKEVYTESGSSSEICEEKRLVNSIICINAIDGSIINPAIGY
jgi:hypothetical protein